MRFRLHPYFHHPPNLPQPGLYGHCLGQPKNAMMRLLMAVLCLTFAGLFCASDGWAAPQPVKGCVSFDKNPEADETQYLGWFKNNCDGPIALIHDFGLNANGSPRTGPWCRERVSDEAYLHGASMLQPGETLGVGWRLKGVAKNIFWAACTVDTARNNSVYIVLEEPEFRFLLPDCHFECESPDSGSQSSGKNSLQ